MAYIVPNTDIVLCRDVPLDSSYDHTVDFADANAQWAYFYSKRYKVVSVNSYQRVMSGRLRIECTMEEAIQCNYLYFRNNNFEDKFIYAFITGWYYINNVTTEISYEIDVFQTFWYDVRLLNVFVDREHDNNDYMFTNTVPENLEQGEYVSNYTSAILPSNSGNCILFYTNFTYDETTDTFDDFKGGDELVGGVFAGLNVIFKPNVTTAQAFFEKVVEANKLDGIIACYMCPFVPEVWGIAQETKSFPKMWGTLDGYSPKNNKLYSYPYSVLHIQTDVQGADFRYELFAGASSATCNFVLKESLIPQPSISLIPADYAGRSGVQGGEFRLTITDFPQVALNADVFKVYLAQNAASLPTKMIGQAANAAVGIAAAIGTGGASLAMPSPSTAVGFPMYNPSPSSGGAGITATDMQGMGSTGGFQIVNSLSGIANTLAQMRDISTKPPQQNGTQTAAADYGMGYKNFMIERLSIRAEFARIIDDYFDMFGYATHRIKQPNITGRPHWNYVKTIGNTVDALGVPDPYLKVMNAAFNNGITIWHNPNEVGYYGLDNRPV